MPHEDTHHRSNRRQVLQGAALSLAGGGALAAAPSPAAEQRSPADREPFGYCLNTSTIRGQNLSVVEQVEIASRAGYGAIEPWIRELEQYVASGGSIDDLAKRIRDAGLTVESAIGFATWAVDDEQERNKALEQLRREMDMLARLGGKRIAAPPTGITNPPKIDPLIVAERYRKVLEVGDQTGVVPQVETWGFSANLSRLGETVLVAVEAGHPKACALPDIYHIHRGGSDFTGLSLLGKNMIHVFHVNDYPATPRAALTDADRVYPGDGVAPLDAIFVMLRDIGFRGHLSLELFNRDYWTQDAFTVARTGLEKTRAAVQKAIG